MHDQPIEDQKHMKPCHAAEILREYGPFPGVDAVHGVTFDGQNVWFASGDKLNALDPESGETVRSIDVAAHAGTAFDGQHLFQIAEDRIQKIDPETGKVLSTIPAPGGGGDSGMAWAEGTLWVGQYRERKIHQIDPETGKILRTIESNRFVTGVTWVDGELWHGTWEGDESDCPAHRPADRRGAGAARHAGRHGRVGARIRRRRPVLLRRRPQRQGARGAPAQIRPAEYQAGSVSLTVVLPSSDPGAVELLRVFACPGRRHGSPARDWPSAAASSISAPVRDIRSPVPATNWKSASLPCRTGRRATNKRGRPRPAPVPMA